MHFANELTNDPARARAYFEDKLAFTTGPVEVERMLKSNGHVLVVDVRASEDFAKGHVPGALNLPEDKWDSLEGISRDRMHIFYCYTQTCHLAARACALFAGRGY